MTAKSVLAEELLSDVHHLRGASVVHAFRRIGCGRLDGPGVQDVILRDCRESYSPALFPPAENAFTRRFKKVGVSENGSRLKHDLDRQILADSGLVGHVLDWETAEVIVHFPALSVAWSEFAFESGRQRLRLFCDRALEERLQEG